MTWLSKASFLGRLSVNFRLNKCHSHTKISDYIGSYLLALIKKVFMENLNFHKESKPIS